MEEQMILKVLRGVNAILTDGHFVYTSVKPRVPGRHGHTYINKDALYAYPVQTALLARLIAEEFGGMEIEAVVGAVTGGAIMSQWVAWHLTRMLGNEVLATYVDRDTQGGFVMKRGYDLLIRKKRVLIVEDVLNSGQTAKAVITAVRAPNVNAKVVGLGAIFNRGNLLPHDFQSVGDISRLFSLVNLPLESWVPEMCPLCAKGVPINVNVGKGRVTN